MIRIPSLDSLSLDEKPLVRRWKGKHAHIGSPQENAKLLARSAGKTTVGTVAMMSGVLLWGAKRLTPFFDASFLNELAEAAFAWHFDWRYFDPEARPHFSPPEQPPEPSATFLLDNFMRESIKGEDQWHSFFAPVMALSHMVSLVDFMLPAHAKPAFTAWLQTTSLRVGEVASVPVMDEPDFYAFPDRTAYNLHVAPRRGLPLPPQVLDPDVDLAALDLAAEAASFIATLHPEKNRFLRPASALLALGFTGIPYHRPTM